MSEIDAAIEVMDRAMDDIAELRRLLAAAVAERDSALADLETARGEGQRQYEYNVEQIAKQAVLEAEIARWADYAATLETERAALREALYNSDRMQKALENAAEATRAKCEAIARKFGSQHAGCTSDICYGRIAGSSDIADAIAALKGKGEGD